MESLTDPLLLNLIIDNNIPPTAFLRVAQNTTTYMYMKSSCLQIHILIKHQ